MNYNSTDLRVRKFQDDRVVMLSVIRVIRVGVIRELV